MILRIGHFEFAPAWFPTLVTALLLVLLLRLGFWQLDRSASKTALTTQWKQYGHMPPERLDTVPHSYVDPQRYMPVTAVGAFDPEHQFLLDNRTLNGVAGYHVITPFRLSGTPETVLVNRGWIAVGPDRTKLPDIRIHSQVYTLQGRVAPIISDSLLLGDSGYGQNNWPKVVQLLQPSRIAEILKRPVRSQLVQSTDDAKDGLIRDWPVHYGITSQRHLGYAVQWFTLALALVTIYVVVNTRRRV